MSLVVFNKKFFSRKNENMGVVTDEVTDDIIAARHYEADPETFARFQALDAINMSWQVAGSLKQQVSLHIMSIFRCRATPVPIFSKTQMMVKTTFPVNK